jgi:uncharacterized protein involved in exopolysaccharide biosynthesis/Mrp family chromosome partitioning ATPase
LELIALLKTCWKRKWVILAFTIVLPLTTIILSIKTTKVYEAVARVRILKFEDAQALLQRQIPENWGQLDHVSGIPTVSQAEVIRSRMVVDPVIHKMSLRRRVTIIDKVLKSIGLVKEYRDEYIRLEKLVEPGFIGAFLQRRQIFIEPMEDSDIIEIYGYSDILEEARDMANEVAWSYVDQAGKIKQRKAREALAIIEANLANTKRQLGTAQDELKRFQARHYVVNLDKRINDIQNNLNNLENTYISLGNDLMVRESRLNELADGEAAPQKLQSTLKSVETYPHIQDLESQLFTLESALAALLTEKTAKHPDVIDLRTRTDVLRKQIFDEIQRLLESEIIELDKGRKAIAANIKDVKKELESLAGTDRQLKDLQRQIDIAESAFLTVSAERESALTAVATNYSNASIITNAVLPDPTDPYYPEPALYVIIATILGVMFGFGMAFIVEFMDISVKTVDDVKQASNLDLLGAIPRIFPPGRIKLKKLDGSDKFAGATLEMKHNVLGRLKDKKVIAVASALKKEGKTTLICRLGAALAEDGHKVALVDLNLKNPAVHIASGVTDKIGISDALLKQVESLNEIAQKHGDFPRLSIFPAGPKSDILIHRLGSPAMKNIIESLKEDHDYVLLDAPGLDGYAGGSVVASLADYALLVVSLEGPSSQELKDKIIALKSAGVEIMGAIANRV